MSFIDNIKSLNLDLDGIRKMEAFNQEPTDRRRAVVQGREKTTWQVNDVQDRHHQIARRIFLGQKNTEIAKALSITETSVSQVRNSPIIKRMLEEMHVEAAKNCVSVEVMIKALAPKAARLMETLIDADPEDKSIPANVRFNAAKDVLDRAGHSPKQRVEHAHVHLTADELRDIRERARQLNPSIIASDEDSDDGDVIELTPEAEQTQG